MMKPVSSVWRVVEHGSPKTFWVAAGTGDEAGWKALAEKSPDRFSIEYCDLVPQSALSDAEARIAELQRERDAFRGVLEGAEYGDIESIAQYDADKARALGRMVGDLSKGIRIQLAAAEARAEAAEARTAELEAENACLKAEREEADNKLVDRYRDPKTGTFSFPGDVAAIVRRLDAAEALLKEAEKALEPFAQEAERYEPDEGDGDDSAWAVPAYFKIRHLRAARAIHHKIGVKDE